MSFILGGITLPRPKTLNRSFLEISQRNTTIEGKGKRKVTARKEEYTLQFQYLTPDEISTILSLFKLAQVLDFEVTEDNFTVSSTPVLMDISQREYTPSGKKYLENITIILIEII